MDKLSIGLRDSITDPTQYFGWSVTKMLSIPRAEIDKMQLDGLRLRFNELRDSIDVLKKLADKQNIKEITSVDDVIPLLFPHTMYKAYPPSLLQNNRFDQITKWLSKLTTHDLSGVDTEGCAGIDDWLDRMDAQSPLVVSHTSGTTGTFSFLPWGKDDFDRRIKHYTVMFFQKFGEPRPDDPIPNIHSLNLNYFTGGQMLLRQNPLFVRYIAGSPERFHSAVPGRFSSDMLYLAGRLRAARAKGEVVRDINPSLLERMRNHELQQKHLPEQIQEFLLEKSKTLRGERIWVLATWNVLHSAAVQALAAGQRQVFASDSVVLSGGGAKGMTPPADWQEKVLEFIGVREIGMSYGMSEVAGCYRACEKGYYHQVPWVIPFVLDPDTGNPLPRTGVQTGRAAFFDLLPTAHWGGFISGDEVTIHWDEPCACGRTTTYYDMNIERYSEKRGGDDKITCAATADAHEEALDFLSSI
jgi:hypothetical protein